MLAFRERLKPNYPEKTPLGARVENQQTQQSHPHMTPGQGIKYAGHIGGRRALSPLRHPCSPYGERERKYIKRFRFINKNPWRKQLSYSCCEQRRMACADKNEIVWSYNAGQTLSVSSIVEYLRKQLQIFLVSRQRTEILF